MSYELFSLLVLVVEAIKQPHVAMVVIVGMVLWMK